MKRNIACLCVLFVFGLILHGCDPENPLEDDIVDALNLTSLVTAPVKNTAVVTTPIDHEQYSGTIDWQTEAGGAVSGNFEPAMVYKAVVTLTAKKGWTFEGIAANAFSYTGATSVTNAEDSGTVTITFRATAAVGEDTKVNAYDLTNFVTPPATGASVLTAPINHAQYTGTIAWQTESGVAVSGSFAASTVYKAVVTLTAKTDFTFTGVAANCFVHSGAASVTNATDSGTVTITFAATSGSQATGNGTEANPYRIYTKADFMAIGGGGGTYQKYYRLEADLTGDNTITAPVGDAEFNTFIGIFDGNGHTVNLDITGNIENSGLFAGVGDPGKFDGEWFAPGIVKNLKLTGTVNVSGNNVKRAGALTGAVNGNDSYVGNIASSVNVIIRGANAVGAGGIVGSLTDTIEHCYSTGDVTIENNEGEGVSAGGISGYGGAISYCWTSGNITASKKTVSTGVDMSRGCGIFGYSTKTIDNCVALNQNISGDDIIITSLSADGTFRIGAIKAGGTVAAIFSNNYANEEMLVNSVAVVDEYDSYAVANSGHGEGVTITATEAANGDWWKTTAGWAGKFGATEAAPWKWDSSINRPVLHFE